MDMHHWPKVRILVGWGEMGVERVVCLWCWVKPTINPEENFLQNFIRSLHHSKHAHCTVDVNFLALSGAFEIDQSWRRGNILFLPAWTTYI